MRKIYIKTTNDGKVKPEGNFYAVRQVCGLRRFILAAQKRGYTYDELLNAWDEAYGLKCACKRVPRRGFRFSGLSLAERLKLATASMDPHDIKLCYVAFIETAMKVYGVDRKEVE